MHDPKTHTQINGPADGARRPPEHHFLHNAWQVFKTIQARLRFIVILVGIGALIAYWDTLGNYIDKWTRSRARTEAAADTEYFCPMHPYIVRDNPKEKCPICNMGLAKRKKGTGEAEPLPPGTVSRVQLSPYRVVLAGVQTTPVDYHALSREMTTFGSVEFDETKQTHIAARQKGRIVKLYVNYTNQMVREGEKLALLDVRYSPELTVTLEDLLRARKTGNREGENMALKRLRLWNLSDQQIEEFVRTGEVGTQLTIYSPMKGHVTRKYQKEGNYVDEGTPLYDIADLDTVWIEAQVYEADQDLLHEGQPVSATTLGLPNEVFAGTLDFIYPHLDESSRTLTARYHIPNPGHKLRPGMYATVKIQVPPYRIDSLQKSVDEQWVEENALDALAHSWSPGTSAAFGFGPLMRSAEGYSMLHSGLLLAVSDSAVIDTGSLKIVYRESSPNTFEGVVVQLGPRMTESSTKAVLYPILRGLQAGDKVVVNGSFLIDAETRLNPSAGSIYFGGSGGKGAPSSMAVRPSTPPSVSEEAAEIRNNLAKLPRDDRLLAEQQTFCPIQPNNRLGAMGVPQRVMLHNQPVFVCCEGCIDRAVKEPDKTLAKVKELKAKTGKHEHH